VPFIGRSGEVLDAALEMAGVSRDEVYITNAAKCQTPGDRVPKPDELKACREVFLNDELIKFKHVPWVLLGGTAIRAVGDQPGGVKENTSRHWTNKSGIVCWGTWHPAAVLRGLGTTKQIAEVIARALGSITLVDVAKTQKLVLAVDTETNGLDPYLGHRPFIASATDGTTGSIFDLDLPVDRWRLQSWINQADEIPMLNAMFDIQMLASRGIKVPPEKVHEVRVQAALADSGDYPYGLEKLADKYFGRGAVYKHKMDEFLKSKGRKFLADGYKDIPVELLHPYALEDAVLTWSLHMHPTLVAARTRWASAYARERRLIKTLLNIETRGVAIDLEQVPKAKAALLAECAQILATIQSHPDVQKINPEFNPLSHPQTAKVLEGLGLESDEFTGSGNPSWGKKVLARLGHEVADGILEYRHLRSIAGGAIDNLPNVVDKSGAFHPSYDQVGSETGRFTARSRASRADEDRRVNMMGIPKLDAVRSLFKARPGFVMFAIDYRQIENRGTAHFSKDLDMIKQFNDNPDMSYYTLAGRLVYGEDVPDSDPRYKTLKAVVLARGYGGGIKKLAKVMGVPINEAEAFVHKLDQAMPGVSKFFKEVEVFVRENGFVIAEDWPKHLDWRVAYQGVNAIVQGACAVHMKRVLNQLDDLVANHDDVFIIHHNHDEIVGEIRYNRVDHWMPKIIAVMMVGFNWSVPIRVKANIGPNWGTMTEWNPKI
jgi:DNA polymerase-1